MNQDFANFFDETLKDLESKNLLRDTQVHDPSLINFAANDYLGLASSTSLRGEASPRRSNPEFGSTGSRLTTGTHLIHQELEEFIAQWKKTEAALVFSSGYLANLGCLSSILTSRDVVFTDELNHSCIFDGIRLSGAKKFLYQHNDIAHLESLLSKHRENYPRALIITDSVFSMDGDRADLIGLDKVASKYNASLYIDEAHATGILGKTGAGLAEELEYDFQALDIQMGTFSKAIGVEGGYIAGSKSLINFLKNKARTFIYSTAAAPVIQAKILENLQLISSDTELRKKLFDNISYFKSKLEAEGINFTNEATAIFALHYKSNEEVLELAAELKDAGILVSAIRPPTSPSPRLRICISARHNHQEIEELIENLSKYARANT